MPLLNVIVKNFHQGGISANSSTDPQQELTGWGNSLQWVDIPNSNTLAKAGMITLEPSSISENPSGAAGYYTIGTNDITISGHPGTAIGHWLTYEPYTSDNYGAYWTTPGTPLQLTEYDPGGGGSVNNYNSHPNNTVNPNQTYNHAIGHDFWKWALNGSYLGEPYEPTHGQPMTYYKYWNSPPTGSYVTLIAQGWDADAVGKWNENVDKVVAVNSMPLNADGTAQQGNKVFLIVILNNGISGSDLLGWDPPGKISVDIDGSPVFIEFENDSNSNNNNNDWEDDDPGIIDDVNFTVSGTDNNNDNEDINEDNEYDSGPDDTLGVIDDITFELIIEEDNWDPSTLCVSGTIWNPVTEECDELDDMDAEIDYEFEATPFQDTVEENNNVSDFDTFVEEYEEVTFAAEDSAATDEGSSGTVVEDNEINSGGFSVNEAPSTFSF